MNNKKKQNEEDGLVENHVELSDKIRRNIMKYAGEKGMTMVEIAEKSGVPINTINSFMHHISNDTKTSNVVRIAKVLGISVDELVDFETLPDKFGNWLKMCRKLPDNDVSLVDWFIRHLTDLNSKNEPDKRYVSVMMPKQDNNGDFEVTADYEKIEITELQEPLRSKIFTGYHIICDHYMPHYRPGDVIFIANDRPPTFNEHAVVRAGKYMFIIRRVVENGIAKYYSIRDGKYRIDESEVDELIGYIGYVKNIKK